MSEELYAAALAALFASRRKGIDFGLERMRECLDKLGLGLHGQHGIAIQVAGTNGKGSTSQMLASVLRAAGCRVGVFSSPHLLSVCERFCLDQGPASREQFLLAYQAIQSCAQELTFFEQMTALAAWIFDDARVDVAIYEVGLGGRLDSTSAIAMDLSLVTGIGLDHEEFLGGTLEKIAAEKAGVFRAHIPAIIGLSAPEHIRQLLMDLARSRGAHPLLVDQGHLLRVPETLALKGAHQRANAALVVAASDALVRLGFAISEESLRAGLRSAQLAGRFQKLNDDLWIDGAHNGQAAEALADLLAAEGAANAWVLIVGLSKEKRVEEFLRPLVPLCSAVVATAGSNDRAQSAQAVASAARSLGAAAVQVVPRAIDALAWARRAYPGQPILVTGSLLLLGELMTALGLGPADPIPLSDPSAPRPG